VIKANLGTTAERTGVDNSGVIAAAQAQLEAAGGSIYELAVNQSGVVRATGSQVRNGRVLLTAGGGTVGVSGEVSAQNANGSGGEILVGGDFRGQNAEVANAARTVVTQTAKLDASAASDGSAAGRVIVWADGATRFLGSLKATGAGGGFAEVSGKRWLDFNPASIVQLGRNGTLLLDPDALIISDGTNSGTTTSGTDPFKFGVSWEVGDIFDFDVPPPSILNVSTLEAQLAVSNVVLDTSTAFGDISFNAPVTWSNNNTLTVRSGNSIYINADITGGTESTLELYTGIRAGGIGELGFPPIEGNASLAADASITVGTLVYGANAFAEYPEEVYTPDGDAPSTGFFWADGNINVDTLRLDLSAGDAGVSTYGTNNTIRAFHATGDHSLSAYVANHNGDLDVTLDETRSSAGLIQFVTAGDLTLTDGSSLTFDEREDDPTYKGTVLFASADGAFINKAGAGVFGGATRFVIYSSTTAATKKGGLVGTLPDTFNHAYDLSEWFDDNDSRFFFTALSGSPILTYKADSLSRSYGAENPTFTFTRTGLIESVIDDVTGTPSLSSSATQSSGVGAYTISVGLGTLSSSNYDFEFENGTLTIERAPLTITANAKTRRVNLENPDFDATFAGFVLDQDESVLGGTLTFATLATSASPVGSYAITPSGLTSANYEITFVPGVLTVTNLASLLITANNASRTYGAANPTFTASYSGFVDGDTESVVTGLQFSTTATQSSGIGNYTITPFGASADGYEISYAPGTLTIERAPLTISIPNQSRLYGDENDFTVNFNGLVNDETSNVVSGLLVTSAASKTSNIGSYAIEASGATADNYSITYSPGMLTITPAPLTVSIDPATRRYGDPDPVFTYTVSGLKNNDSEGLVTVNNMASLASANAGIGDYGIVGFPFVSSSNYSVAEQVFGSLTITPRLLTIRADNATRVYGDVNPTFTASYDGLASFDTPALFGDIGLTTQANQTSGVGEWGITFGAVANQNYTITREFGTLTITPAPLIFDALLDVSRLYGRADPTLVMPAVGGLKNDDTVAGLGLSFTGVPEARADAGSYTYSVAATNPNYTFTAPTATFRIDPAPLTVAIGSTGRVYGDENPASYDLRVTGLAFDDTATSVIGVNNPTEARTDVGTYAVTPTLLNYNYVIESFTGGNFVISPRLLTFTAADRTKVYGEINPFFFGSISGFLEGDSELNIVTNYGFVSSADQTSGVGTYWIRPTAQLTTSNYVATFVDGTLTIERARASITGGTASRPYGDVIANPLSIAFAGFVSADEALARSNWQLVFTDRATLTPGANTIDFTQAQPETGAALMKNYDITFTPGTLNVTPRPFVITAPDYTSVLGEAFTNPFAIPSPVFPEGAPTFSVFGHSEATGGTMGVFKIVPEIVPGAGGSQEELNRYYAFELQPGVHTIDRPQEVIDLTQTLDPGRFNTLNNGGDTIFTDNQTTNETVEVKRETVTVSTNPDVPFDNKPLTRAEYASYFESFGGEMHAVRASLASTYATFLEGAGKKDSVYEGMSAEGRALLAGWMKGSVTMEALRDGIASGNAAAIEAFGFIMPTMIERTRDKNIEDLTMVDRSILGRLADLTEKRRDDTVRIAQQKYEVMIAEQAQRGEIGSAATVLFYGPGDFQNIVDRATEEAVGAYVGGVLAGASVITLAPMVFFKSVSWVVFPQISQGGIAAAGPAVAAVLAVVLAIRSVQISESIKNEEAFHALIASAGKQITSIADLKSPAMDQEMKISTLMLASELLTSQ